MREGIHIFTFFTDEKKLHMVSHYIIHIEEDIGISECSKHESGLYKMMQHTNNSICLLGIYSSSYGSGKYCKDVRCSLNSGFAEVLSININSG